MVKRAKGDQFNVIRSPRGSGMLYALFIAQLRGGHKESDVFNRECFLGSTNWTRPTHIQKWELTYSLIASAVCYNSNITFETSGK